MGELPEEYDGAWIDFLPPEAKLEWLRQGVAGANPPPEPSGTLPLLSDPELAGYVGLGSNASRRKALQGQLERGQALQSQGQGQYTSILGAALGGLGSIVNTGIGMHQQRKAQRGLDELTASEQAARSRFARGAQTWDPAQAANLGILSGDPVLGAYGGAVQNQVQNSDTRGLRGVGLEQAKRRLELLEQEAARKAATGKEKFDADKWKSQQMVAGLWRGLGLREEELEDRRGDRSQRNEGDLRNELERNPVTKAYRESSVAFQKVQQAAQDPSAAGDLALIFGVMKTLDPGSTVREGEFANAQNAAGVPDRIRAAFNNITSGQRLTPEQRRDFVRTAEGQHGAQRRAYEQLANSYRGLASQTGAAPDRVVLPDIDLTQSPPISRSASQPSDQDRAAMQWLQSNPNDPRAPAIRKRLQEKGLIP